MTHLKKSPGLVLLVLAAGGCASPLHLTYDYGRAYTESVVAQADLTRGTAADQQYWLYGNEAAEIRIQVQKTTTDAESGKATLKQK